MLATTMYRCTFCNTLITDINKTCIGCGSRDFVPIEDSKPIIDDATDFNIECHDLLVSRSMYAAFGLDINNSIINNRTGEVMYITGVENE